MGCPTLPIPEYHQCHGKWVRCPGAENNMPPTSSAQRYRPCKLLPAGNTAALLAALNEDSVDIKAYFSVGVHRPVIAFYLTRNLTKTH